MQFKKNKKVNRIPSFHVVVTLLSIFFINYFSNIGVHNNEILILFIILHFLLYSLNPICAFVFCFVVNLNIMSYPTNLWFRPVTITLSFLVFILNPKLIPPLFKNIKLKNIFHISLLFSFFLITVSLMSKSDLSFKVFFEQFNILFGFLIFLPAYYFTIKQPKNLFICLSAVASCFLVTYYTNLIFELNLFKIGEINATIESELTRYAGYDLRQFIIFFIFLIPAFLLTKAVSIITKYVIISVGVFAFIVLMLGIYRLAMFYNIMGLLLSLYFISKYEKTDQLLKRFFFIAIFIGITVYFYGDYFAEFQKVYEGTFEYFNGNGEDKSADERFLIQTPILMAYVYKDFWTGCGLVEASLMTQKGMYGFVDIPILGSLAKFGVIGVFIYYIRYYLILRNENKLAVRSFLYYDDKQKLLFFIYLTMKAYIISLITFRLFYISWELAFDWQQAEFGLFIGCYLALERLIIENENTIFQNTNTKIVNKNQTNISNQILT